MGYYGTRRNYNSHNFNTSTLLIDGSDKAEGLMGFDFELDEDETTVSTTADGQAQFVDNPSLTGTVKIRIKEASPTSAVMWALWKAKSSFSLAFSDSNIADLNCSAQKARIAKAPALVRGKDPSEVEWICKATYLDVMGGSFSLESA